MAIAPGTRLGVYEVVAQIGAGGMGEVYRAHDTRLNRDVALKVLPEAFSRDMERMARFEREAKVLASLNHTNIAAIYGFEESGPIRALVMELVEGPTLADRIRGGAMPVDEALPIARQVADAVEYAHDKNVIHRDLKPANIKVTPEGTVKVLDFGLAKALSDEVAAEDMSNSPTLSMAATRRGVILGTAAYMSPEQAKGITVDRRADVWAFGCVLYEMLTGKPVFVGDDVTEVLAAVVRADPDWNSLPAAAPNSIRNLLRRCLEKTVRRRLGHISEARIVVEDVLSGAVPAEQAVAQQRKGLFANSRLARATATAAIVIAALAWGAFVYFWPSPPQLEAIRFFVSPPESWGLLQVSGPGGSSPAPLAISPDGRRLAFAAVGADGKSFLWVRSLDTLTAQMLAGTEGAAQPFWSPDSRFLAFHTGEKLKKIALSGGSPITLCDAPAGQGGAWSRDVVLFASNLAGSPIYRVPASGGAPTAATNVSQGDPGHGRPTFLPDGRHFLYRAGDGLGGSIYLTSLDSPERKLLLKADATPVVYSAGHVLFLRERTLMAQSFDLHRLELAGEAFPIAEEIQTNGTNPNAVFSASENGVLAYQTGTGGNSRLLWFDRSGKQIGILGDQAAYTDIQLSPDGKQAAVSLPDQSGGSTDIWLYDAVRGLKTRFTFDRADEFAPIWSPDGKHVVFNSRRKGHLDLYQKAANGTGAEEMLLEDSLDKFPMSFSPDGKLLLYLTIRGPTGSDLYVLPLSGDRKPTPFLNAQFNEGPGQFSPDGRWVAYVSNESGRNDIYVAPFPGPGGKRQISAAGGSNPRWRSDGSEIFYATADNKLMAAAVNGKGQSFEVGAVKPLFEVHRAGFRYFYDVSLDGSKFLINTPPEQSSAAPMTVVVNWAALQK